MLTTDRHRTFDPLRRSLRGCKIPSFRIHRADVYTEKDRETEWENNGLCAASRLFASLRILGRGTIHRQVWAAIGARTTNGAVLVLEEDVIVTDETMLKIQLRDLNRHAAPFPDLTLFGTLHAQHNTPASLSDIAVSAWLAVFRPKCTPGITSAPVVATSHLWTRPLRVTGAHAYAITPSCARRLLSLLPTACYHVDFELCLVMPQLTCLSATRPAIADRGATLFAPGATDTLPQLWRCFQLQTSHSSIPFWANVENVSVFNVKLTFTSLCLMAAAAADAPVAALFLLGVGRLDCLATKPTAVHAGLIFICAQGPVAALAVACTCVYAVRRMTRAARTRGASFTARRTTRADKTS